MTPRPTRHSGWPCRSPAMSSATWPPTTAAASGPSSSAAPTSIPARPNRCSSPAGTPSPPSARPAPNGPRRCAPRSAARAGTSRPNPSVDPDPADDVQRMWVEHRAETQHERDHAAGGRARHRRADDELIADLDEEITRSGHARQRAARPARPPSPVHPPAPGRPGPAPPRLSPRPRSARPTPPRTARRSARRCSSP